MDDSIGVIIKRPGAGRFKCHLFVFDNVQAAHDTCATLQKVASEAFRLVGVIRELCDAHLEDAWSAASRRIYCSSPAHASGSRLPQLRKVSKRMRKKEVDEGPPDLPKRAESVADEEQPWFHGPMGRDRAEQILQGFAACDGLFFVRASERSVGSKNCPRGHHFLILLTLHSTTSAPIASFLQYAR